MSKFNKPTFVMIVTLIFCSMTLADESRSNMEAEYRASCVGKFESGVIQKFGFPERVHQATKSIKFLMYRWVGSDPSNFCSVRFTMEDNIIKNINVAESKNPLLKHGACAQLVTNWYSTRVDLSCD